MTTVFTRIIEGEIPARFVWKDDQCVAFLTANPIRAGHVLVVPREEVDHWLDLDTDLTSHLMEVARAIGRALEKAYKPQKVGFMLAGLEVPHVHIHVLPIDDLQDLSFENAEQDPDPAALDEEAEKIRAELEKLGFHQVAS